MADHEKLDNKYFSFSSNDLSSYKSEHDPKLYEECYMNLFKFIDSSLDSYKYELYTLIYPVFVHLYLELVYNNHEEAAKKFMDRFGPHQEDFYQEDLKKLAIIKKPSQMKESDIIDNFNNGQSRFTIKLSKDTFYYLKRYLQDYCKSTSIIQNVIQEHLSLDFYEGLTRNKQQVEAALGGMMGEAPSSANKIKLFLGLLKEPELKLSILDDDGDDANVDPSGEGGEKPKKKKSKRETLLSKKSRNDPNAPPLTRIPLPELRDADKMDKIHRMREATKGLKLSSEVLPSICFYSLLNANVNNNIAVLCIEISEDSALLSAGLSDSTIKVWSLTPNKLKTMRSAQELELIDKEADDVLIRMMDEKTATESKVLHGHSGPVYSLSFSPDRNLLLSCSEDSTRHCFPVWDVVFSPHGYYFATCGHDRTARLWATDSHQPLRFFVGHFSDVDCIQFHPNSNYVASGSTDRTIRVWDVLNGQCVRYFTGHKAKIYTLLFTKCGRYLISAGEDRKILVWDLSHGYLISCLSGHTDTIYSLAISRDGVMLASGGADDCIMLWDLAKLLDDADSEDINLSQTPTVQNQYGQDSFKNIRNQSY